MEHALMSDAGIKSILDDFELFEASSWTTSVGLIGISWLSTGPTWEWIKKVMIGKCLEPDRDRLSYTCNLTAELISKTLTPLFIILIWFFNVVLGWVQGFLVCRPALLGVSAAVNHFIVVWATRLVNKFVCPSASLTIGRPVVIMIVCFPTLLQPAT